LVVNQFQPGNTYFNPEMFEVIVSIEGMATGREMRTAPLWGLRATGTYLHDERAATVKTPSGCTRAKPPPRGRASLPYRPITGARCWPF
jgi:hypothetical protein